MKTPLKLLITFSFLSAFFYPHKAHASANVTFSLVILPPPAESTPLVEVAKSPDILPPSPSDSQKSNELINTETTFQVTVIYCDTSIDPKPQNCYSKTHQSLPNADVGVIFDSSNNQLSGTIHFSGDG